MDVARPILFVLSSCVLCEVCIEKVEVCLCVSCVVCDCWCLVICVLCIVGCVF